MRAFPWRDVPTHCMNTPGIIKAQALSTSELNELLEPWLGEGNIGENLPIPAMISVTLSETAFTSKFKDAVLCVWHLQSIFVRALGTKTNSKLNLSALLQAI